MSAIEETSTRRPLQRPSFRLGLVALVLALGAVGFFAMRGDEPTGTSKTAAAADTTEEHEEEQEVKRVTLTKEGFATAQIQVEPVRLGAPALASSGLEVPAQVEFDPRRIGMVSPRVDGRIERLLMVEGDRVSAGQVVAYLNSKEYLIAQSDMQQASRRAALLSDGPDAAGAQAIAQAARRRMAYLGVSAAEVSRIERGGEPGLYLPVISPISGSVMKSHLLFGQAVHAGDPIYTIADLREVDVVAEVPERSLPMVRIGQAASVSLAAFPSVPFTGRVERLRDELNPETRTVRAVIHVSNSNGQLRPGMFASVRLAVASSAFPELRIAGDTTREAVLTIAESAVVTDGERRYVFVQVAPLTFERREVEVAPLAPPGSSLVNSAFLLVREGVKAGERVVTRGAFTLKSELAKAGLGEHGH